MEASPSPSRLAAGAGAAGAGAGLAAALAPKLSALMQDGSHGSHGSDGWGGLAVVGVGITKNQGSLVWGALTRDGCFFGALGCSTYLDHTMWHLVLVLTRIGFKLLSGLNIQVVL